MALPAGCARTPLADPPPGETASTTLLDASPSPSLSPSPTPSQSASPEPILDGASARRALATVEPAIRNPATPEADLGALGRRQQILYRALVANPQWRADALAQLPEALVPVERANIEAGEELRALTRPQKSLPPWRIVEPPPAAELLSYYKQAEAEFGIPWQYLAAVHLVESRLGRIRGPSTAGALGC